VTFRERPLSWLAVSLVKLYQKTLSRLWPGVCIYFPSCSHYTIHAIRTSGLGLGVLLGVWRILRCHPLAKGGYDPPPGYEEWLESLPRPGNGWDSHQDLTHVNQL
jgi:putative membrane protein insertion efficiency factor